MSSQPPSPLNLNLQRSLQYYQKDVLQPEAWFSIVEHDYTQLIASINWGNIFPEQETEFQLLDVGCGTGRFPKMLQPHLPSTLRIQYDCLDPSQYCLTTCQQTLNPPFIPRHAWQTTLEHAQEAVTKGTYDLVWAIQSLYCLEEANLHTTLTQLIQALHPSQGTACILLARRQAFFPQVHRLFYKHSTEPSPPPYLSAESIMQALEEIGAMSVICQLTCTHTIPVDDERLLEHYLQQSVMDDTPLLQWRQCLQLRDFIDSYRHNDMYHFHNPYWLILSIPPSAEKDGTQRLHSFRASLHSSSPTISKK